MSSKSTTGRYKNTHMARGQKTLLLMTVPSILFIIVFSYLPISGWIYSFFDYRIGYKLSTCEFVGLDNFRYVFGDPYILTVIGNTLIISLAGLLGLPLAGIIAILLSEVRGRTFKKTVQTAITIPNFISWIIIYSIMFSLFSNDGLLTTIIFFAAITGIDSQLYDAAAVDGAGRWKKMLHITIPGMLPTLITLLIISIGAILNNGFEQYYVFVNPMIQEKMEVLDYYVYRIGMLNNDIPASTAVSMVKTFISIGLVFGVNKLSKKTLGQSIL